MANPNMVDAKREKEIERKIPSLLAPWWSSKYDLYDYRLLQFKKKAPDTYNQKRNNVIKSINDLELTMDTWWMETHKKRRDYTQPQVP
jgi:hypothetical protein